MSKKIHIPGNDNDIDMLLEDERDKSPITLPAEVGFTADDNPKDNKKEIDVVSEKETTEKTTGKTTDTRADGR